MKNGFLVLLFLIAFISCKESKNKDNNKLNVENSFEDTICKTPEYENNRAHSLIGTHNFKDLLKPFRNVEDNGGRNSDWMTDQVGFLDKLLGLNADEIVVETSSFTFKKDCVFYIHSLKHVSNTISVKPYVEEIQGKRTEGYTQVRVLVFGMKNEKEANIIDIPPNYGYSKLRKDLIGKIYSEIDFPVISCDTMEICKMRNF